MKNDLNSMWRKIRVNNWAILTNREFWLLIGIGAALLAASIYLALSIFEPPPPKTVRMSTGGKSGAYFKYANQYAQQFKKHGITLEVLESNGSQENLNRLNDKKSQVDIAFVQSGIGDAQTSPNLESIGTVAYEPIWVLQSAKQNFKRLSELKGKRILTGPVGSGSYVVAIELLKANGIDESNTTLTNLGAEQALQVLREGNADAMITIAAPAAPLIVNALDSGMVTMGFDQADAYVRRYPWLSKVTLPKGSSNLSTDFPSNDLTLIAVSANLVVRADAHPAIMFLLLDVASDIHKAPGPVHNYKQFPSDQNLTFPQSAESKRFFTTGRPFLQRYLPFWLANLVERLLVSIVPVLAIAIPLIKLIPALFDFQEKSTVLQHYEKANQIEAQVLAGTLDTSKANIQIRAIMEQVDELKLGASRHTELYNLKAHIAWIQERLNSPHQQRA
jgi:TRAP transporter TAXI family solute receptor